MPDDPTPPDYMFHTDTGVALATQPDAPWANLTDYETNILPAHLAMMAHAGEVANTDLPDGVDTIVLESSFVYSGHTITIRSDNTYTIT